MIGEIEVFLLILQKYGAFELKRDVFAALTDAVRKLDKQEAVQQILIEDRKNGVSSGFDRELIPDEHFPHQAALPFLRQQIDLAGTDDALQINILRKCNPAAQIVLQRDCKLKDCGILHAQLVNTPCTLPT